MQADGELVDQQAFDTAMKLLHEDKPSVDWEQGLKSLRKATGEPEPTKDGEKDDDADAQEGRANGHAAATPSKYYTPSKATPPELAG